MADLDLTPELLRRYDRPVPRYTSYPTADRFTPAFTAKSYVEALQRAMGAGQAFSHVSIERATLEDVFLHLTGRSLRD